MNNNPDDDRWLIWSYEHDAWWGPGGWGYTSVLAKAGHYERAEADRIVAKANIVKVNEVAVALAKASTFPPAMDDDTLILTAAHEMGVRDATLEMVLQPPSAFQLAALIQLALRHPNIAARAGSQRTGVMFLEHVRAYFADAPAILEMLRRGDDDRLDDGKC